MKKKSQMAQIYAKTKLGSSRSIEHILNQKDFDPLVLVLADSHAMCLNEMHYPPLHHAALNGHTSVLKLMIKCSDKTIIDYPHNKVTPLILAIHSRCIHCVEALLQAGADPNFNIDSDIMTPLRFAVEECSNFEIIRALVEFEANPIEETIKFSSPIEFVNSRLMPCDDEKERMHWEAIIELFEEYYE